MSQLDVFNQGTSNYTLDDFNTDPATASPITSMGTNRNVAAHAALLAPKPEDIPQVYNQSFDELNGQGQSQTADAMLANAQGQTLSGLRSATADLLSDPTKPDEWKQAALDAISNDQHTLFDPRAMAATKAAAQPVQGESDESGQLRGLVAGAITSVLQYQREKQKFFNEMQVKQAENPESTEWVAAGESLVPGTMGFKQARLFSSLNDNTLGTIASFFLPGSSNAAMAEKFNALPLEERSRLFDSIGEAASQDGQTILLPAASDQGNFAAIRNIVDEGSYTVTDETVDNLLGVLDVMGIGGWIRGATKGAKAITKAGETAVATKAGTELTAEQSAWQRRYTLTDAQPTAPMETVKDVNPTMARNLHQAVEADESGDLAGALYGTSRTDAVAHDISPQVATPDGRVQSKVHNTERDSDFGFMPDSEVLDFVDNSGASYLSPAEKRVLRGNTVNDFQNATGVVPRKEMLTVEDLPDGLSLKGVYGPTDSGWADLGDAFDQAKFAMRKYGISDDDITVLHRVADEYIPIDKGVQRTLMDANNSQIKGDYLLQINHRHKFNAGDMADEGWEAFDVKNNIMDEWAKGTGRGAQGSAASNLLDPQSMLHPSLTQGATVGVNRASQIEVRMGKVIEDYAKSVRTLKGPEQQKLFEQIRMNNVKGQDFNYTDMIADGYSENAVKAAQNWKRAQDTMYEITNRDLVKSYRARGYGVMEDSKSGTRLFVREQGLAQVPDGARVYDPVQQTSRIMTKDEMKTHYDGGGNIGKLHDFITVDGEAVEHVLNANKAGSTYVRSLKDTDHVLSYRKGYYAVRYDNPHFIEKKVLGSDGKPVLDANGRPQWRVVATADNTPNAIRGRKRLAATHGGNWETDYRHRSDLKGDAYDQARAGHLQAGGLSSQRIRGQRLEEALGDNNISNQVNIENPINSLIHSASSVSNRVAMRDWLESAKSRFMAQYADELPKVRGQVQFPASRDEIGAAGVNGSRAARDARTTWEYIRSMENGYHNSIDSLYKGTVNRMADIVGAKGFGRSENALRALGGAGGPTAQLKQVAFHLLLALNPLRQFLVQSHQILMLAAAFPRYSVARLVPDMTIMMTKHLAEGRAALPEGFYKALGRDAAWADKAFDALKKSGIADGIKSHELVRSSLNSLADGSATLAARRGSSALKTAMAPVAGVARWSRKIGFDFGEYLSSSASFMAHYDDALRNGVKMDAAGIESTFAKSRNYVYNMDRAGAMPYNHNSVSLFTQFMQVPHKALTQLFFNRGISAKTRFLMTTYMVAMFGPNSIAGIIPGAGNAIDSLFQNLFPEDPEMRQALRSGLEGVLLNKMFSSLYGDDVKLDYSSLAPLDAYGMLQFVEGMFVDNSLMKMAAATPGGSLLFGSNPRVMNLASDLGRLMGYGALKDEDPIKVGTLFMDIGNLSSGFSNAFKASMALQYSKKYGAMGGIVDGKVNTFEAVAAAFGIPTLTQEGNRKAMDEIYKSGASQDEDVKKVFGYISRTLTAEGITADQYDYVVAQGQAMMAAFPDNQRAQQAWKQQMDKQMNAGDFRIVDALMKASGFMKKNDFYRVLDQSNSLTQEQKDNLKAVADYNFDAREDKGN